jgi:hypothetical protein
VPARSQPDIPCIILIQNYRYNIVVCRRVPWVRAGYTCGGRRVRRARVDGFFFSKPYLIRLIPVPVAGTRVRVRGYSGTGRRVRVREFFFLLHFLFYKYFFLLFFFQRVRRVRVLIWCEPGGKFLKFEFHGYADTTGFFQKKTLLKPVPVYPPIPGHGYGYRGYRARVHGYGLYPAGFSKPLIQHKLRWSWEGVKCGMNCTFFLANGRPHSI